MARVLGITKVYVHRYGGILSAYGLSMADAVVEEQEPAKDHPQLAGGSHLPDITVITPVFHEGNILFFVASRGHHSDIVGTSTPLLWSVIASTHELLNPLHRQ